MGLIQTRFLYLRLRLLRLRCPTWGTCRSARSCRMSDGTKVTTPHQWKQQRPEVRRILEYYAVGAMPPAPGNVKGREVKLQTILDGAVKYRLVHLTFGPDEKLSLDIGIFTPFEGGPFPAVIRPAGAP